jgi:hypothetical protein
VIASFYQLKASDPTALWQYSLSLIEEAFDQKKPLLILTSHTTAKAQIDTLLWSKKKHRFLAHTSLFPTTVPLFLSLITDFSSAFLASHPHLLYIEDGSSKADDINPFYECLKPLLSSLASFTLCFSDAPMSTQHARPFYSLLQKHTQTLRFHSIGSFLYAS